MPGHVTDDDGPPTIQRKPVETADGAVLRPARVEQGEWTDPDDTQALERGPDGRRRARKVKGFRVIDPIRNLHAHNPGEITERHVRAADRLRDDHEIGEGIRNGRSAAHVSGGSGAGPTDAMLDAAQRYRGAVQAVPPSLWGCLAPLVFHGWTVARLAEARGTSAVRLTGYVQAALDALCDHYWPDRPVVGSPVPMETVDGSERVGRWRDA